MIDHVRAPIFIFSIWNDSTWSFIKTEGSADGQYPDPNAYMRDKFRQLPLDGDALDTPDKVHRSNLRQAEAAVRVIHRFGNDKRDRAIRTDALLKFADETDFDVTRLVQSMLAPSDIDSKPIAELRMQRAVGTLQALTDEFLRVRARRRSRAARRGSRKAAKHSQGSGPGSFSRDTD